MNSPGSMRRILTILLALVFVGGGGFVYKAFSELSSVDSHLSELRAQAKDETQIKQDVQKSQEQLLECAMKLQHLEAGVPDSAYIPTLLTELEKTGRACGIEVTGVRPMPADTKPQPQKNGSTDTDSAAKKKPYDEVGIQVSGHGDYASVLRFMAALQTFPKIVAARTVTLAPKAGDQEKGIDTLDVQIELRAYIFKPLTQSTRIEGEVNG